jgi:hypothetical protein
MLSAYTSMCFEDAVFCHRNIYIYRSKFSLDEITTTKKGCHRVWIAVTKQNIVHMFLERGVQLYAFWGRVGLFRIDDFDYNNTVQLEGQKEATETSARKRLFWADITGHLPNKILKCYCSIYLAR